jgi:hypothetical protein
MNRYVLAAAVTALCVASVIAVRAKPTSDNTPAPPKPSAECGALDAGLAYLLGHHQGVPIIDGKAKETNTRVIVTKSDDGGWAIVLVSPTKKLGNQPLACILYSA